VFSPLRAAAAQMYDAAAGTVDLRACRLLADDPSVARAVSHAAVLALDAARLEPACAAALAASLEPQGPARVPLEALDWNAALSPLQMPVLGHKAFHVAFCAPMQQKSRIVYLLSKTVLQRCMTRKFGGVCLATFRESRKTCDTVKLMVLATLLGAYAHSEAASRQLDGALRRRLYERLWDHRDEPAHHEWFLALTAGCPYLLEFCLRDHLLFQLDDDRALAEHAGQLFDVARFRLVLDLCTRMLRRRYAVHHFAGSGVGQLCRDLSAALQPFHTALLALSYRLPNSRADLFATLVSLRESVPLDGQPASRASAGQAAPREPDEDAEIRGVMDSMAARDVLAQIGVADDLLALEAAAEPEAAEPERPAAPLLESAAALLGAGRLATLDGWARVLGPTRRDALKQFVALLPLVGVRPHAAANLGVLLEELRLGSLKLGVLRRLLRALNATDLLAYQCLQVGVDLLKLHSRVVLLRRLPARTVRAQLASFQSGFTCLPGSPHALYDSPEFVFCSVCNAVYSMLREFKATFKKIYVHGLRDAVVDYRDDFVYCWRGKRSARGSCASTPLVRVPLVGLLLQHAGQNIMLCADPACGAPMVLDVARCHFGPHGPLCSKCTEREGCAERAERERLDALEAAVQRCVVCFAELRRPSAAFFYGADAYLCATHSSRQMLAALRVRAACKGAPLTGAELRLQIVEVHRLQQKERTARKQALWKRQVAQSKLSHAKRR